MKRDRDQWVRVGKQAVCIVQSMSFRLELVTNLRSQPVITGVAWAGLSLEKYPLSFRGLELEIISCKGPSTEQVLMYVTGDKPAVHMHEYHGNSCYH